MNLSELATVLGYCGLINIIILLIWFLAVIFAKQLTFRLHSKLFNLPEDQLMPIHYHLMGQFKLLNFMFFIVPWAVLRFLG